MQLVQACLADGVRAAQADGLVAAAVKLIVADRTGQELRPLGRLHRHPGASGGSCAAQGQRMPSAVHTGSSSPAAAGENKKLKLCFDFVLFTMLFWNIFGTLTADSSRK